MCAFHRFTQGGDHRDKIFSNFLRSLSGVLNEQQYSLKHIGSDLLKGVPGGEFEPIKLDAHLASAFSCMKFVRQTINDMRVVMSKWAI